MTISIARRALSRLPELHGVLIGSGFVQLGGMAFTMLLGIQLARVLGPVNYGIYGTAMAFVSLLGAPAQAGLPVFATREASRAVANGSRTSLKSLFFWFIPRTVFIASVTAFLGLLIAVALNKDTLLSRIAEGSASAALIIALALSAVLGALLRGIGLNIIGQAVDMVAKPAITSALILLFVLLGGKLAVADALFLQLTATGACVLIAVKFYFGRSRDYSERHIVYRPGRWWGVVTAYTAHSLLAVFNGNYPILMAGLICSAADTGILRVALSATALLALPSSIANIATLPIVARQSAEHDHVGVSRTLGHTTIAAAFCTAMILLIVIFFGRYIISFLFGPVYVSAYGSVVVLGIANLLVSFFGITGSYLNMTGREQIVVKAFIVSVVIGSISAFLLGRVYGIIGISAGAVITNAAWHFYVFVVHRREVQVPLFVGTAIKHVLQRRI